MGKQLNGFLQPRLRTLEVGDEVEHPNHEWCGRVVEVEDGGVCYIEVPDVGRRRVHQQALRYMPSQETIAQRAADVRATWTPARWLAAIGRDSQTDYSLQIEEISTAVERVRSTVRNVI